MRPPTPADPGTQRLYAALAAEDWPLLARLCRRALRHDARQLSAHRLLGFALGRLRQFDAALAAYRQATRLWPEDAELLVNHANLLIEQARNDEALPLLEKMCALRPDQAIGWIKLAECCYLLNFNEKGFAASQSAAALARQPHERVAALMQSAIHRRELGQVREAIQDCESAIALRPEDPGNHTNRLLFMLSEPRVDAAQLAAAARQYGATFEPPLRPHWPRFEQHQGAAWRRLKIGFLSPDFRVHSVMYFVEGLLAQLDRRQFEVFAFYLFPRDDQVTERVRRHADHFLRLAGLDAQRQAEAIRAQGIDILIDLAGHTGHNGLLALARKAAPVQVSWLGFPASTGLEAVDYRLSDAITDPPDAQSQYTEQLHRLPTLFACYRPMSRQPLWRYQPRYQPRPTPALSQGCVTFGSCNNLGKLGDEVLALWGQLLAAVPGARLLIEGRNLERPDFAQAYAERCRRLGLDPGRLELLAMRNDQQYLNYHRIDIALDPFPLNGGTTSFDALWMGLPLVAMQGQSFRSRMGLGLLSHLGRSEWLAATPQDYLRIARELATDIPALNRLRLGLREEMERSPLMREDQFNRHFGQGLRSMWLQWLAKRRHPDKPQAQAQAIADWQSQAPEEWAQAPEPGVGLQPGQRVSLAQAHARLQELVAKARSRPHNAAAHAQATAPPTLARHWRAVTELAETVLSAAPHDPVALSCLAEVEYAHGHSAFALVYLQHATKAMGQGSAATAGLPVAHPL